MDKLMPWIILAALLVWGAWPVFDALLGRIRAWWRAQPSAHEATAPSHHEPQGQALIPPPPHQTQATAPNTASSNDVSPGPQVPRAALTHEPTPRLAPQTTSSPTDIQIPLSALAGPPRAPEDTQVLVVDDSKVLRVKISRLLIKHGYQVSLAEDGAQAARHLTHTMPHLLITDVDMPVMNGLELSHHVRTQPHMANLPIIIITSAQEKYAPQAAAIGVKVVLGKPYRDDELIAQVTSSLSATSPACKPQIH